MRALSGEIQYSASVPGKYPEPYLLFWYPKCSPTPPPPPSTTTLLPPHHTFLVLVWSNDVTRTCPVKILWARFAILMPKNFKDCFIQVISRAPDKRGNEANSKIIFLIFSWKTCFDPSLEPSRWDGSNDASQHVLKDLPYFFGYKTEFFSFQNNPKDLDPSCKMDLDLWDCLGRVKLVL